jgi:hypothetical protein
MCVDLPFSFSCLSFVVESSTDQGAFSPIVLIVAGIQLDFRVGVR